MATPSQAIRPSPFLNVRSHAEAGSLAILYLRRDQSIASILQETDEREEGYEEGKVTNTRFGSFPHTTLIGLPWGSQVRASKVDTGSRGRKAGGLKRKREAEPSEPSTPSANGDTPAKAAVTAQSGYIHLLPPTPENWTSSLPHRTQVVYTPDYSFVLQRLQARPGSTIIEAGAGSGSFTHAAARAVFNGYPLSDGRAKGKVWSFEFHQPRVEKLQEEIRDHGLEGVVEVTHRDVYEDGFGVVKDGSQAVRANAVFLDLPAPWLALGNLKRRSTTGPVDADSQDPPVPPLDPSAPIRICCFLPCIEQVQRTVIALQSHCWLEISVIELAAKRIEVRRERVGVLEEGLRGVNASAATVEEALGKLREVEERTRLFHAESTAREKCELANGAGPEVTGRQRKQEKLREIQEVQENRKVFKEGRLVTRCEPELKTHTGYLVFAVLPVEWTEEDERKAREKWAGGKIEKTGGRRSRAKNAKKGKKGKDVKREQVAMEVDGIHSAEQQQSHDQGALGLSDVKVEINQEEPEMEQDISSV